MIQLVKCKLMLCNMRILWRSQATLKNNEDHRGSVWGFGSQLFKLKFLCNYMNCSK